MTAASNARAGMFALNQRLPPLTGTRIAVDHGVTWACSIAPAATKPRRPSSPSIQSCATRNQAGSVQTSTHEPNHVSESGLTTVTCASVLSREPCSGEVETLRGFAPYGLTAAEFRWSFV